MSNYFKCFIQYFIFILIINFYHLFFIHFISIQIEQLKAVDLFYLINLNFFIYLFKFIVKCFNFQFQLIAL